jgi:hypothetical protein
MKAQELKRIMEGIPDSWQVSATIVGDTGCTLHLSSPDGDISGFVDLHLDVLQTTSHT